MTDGALETRTDADAGRVIELRELGLEHARRGKLERALAALDEARRLCRDLGDEPLLSDIYADLGDVHAERHEMDAAVDAYKRALELDQEHRDHRGQALVLRGLGVAYIELGDLGRADDALREAERHFERVGEDGIDSDRARLQIARGRLLMDQAKYRDAAERFDIALDTAKRLADLALEVLSSRHLAAALHESGRSGEAISHLERAEAILQLPDQEDVPELIEVQNLHGSILEDSNSTDRALELFRSSLRDAEDLKLEPAQAETLRRMASAYAVRGDLARSQQHYERAIEICRRLKDEPALSQLYGDLGDVLLEAGETEAAIVLFKDALRLDADHKDSLGKALAHRRLGTAYQARGLFSQAEDAYEEAEALLKNTDDEGELAVVCNHLGSLLLEQGHFQKAKERFERALEISRRHGNETGEAISLRWRGAARRELGARTEAEKDLRHAEEILVRQGGEDLPELVEVRVELAAVLDDLGRTSAALELLADALRDARQLDNAPLTMRVLGRTAAALADAGDLSRALERYQEAIDIAERLKDEPELSELLGAIGDVLAKLGRHDEAVDHYRSALELDQEHQDTLGRAIAHRRLGSAHQASGEFPQAEQSYKSAASALARADDKVEEATLSREWGSLHQEQGHFRKALDYYEKALALHGRGDDGLGAAVTHRLMASAHLQLGDVHDAERHLGRAAEELRRTGDEDPSERVEQLDVRARITIEQHDLRAALNLAESALDQAERLRIPPLEVMCLRTRATILVELGRHPKAIDSLRQALELAQPKDNLLLARLEDDLGDVHLSAGRPEDAVAHYTAGRKKIAKLDQPALMADILLGLARCQRQLGHLEAVRQLLDDAKEAIDEVESSDLVQARLSLELAQLDELDGQHDAAVENYENALDVFSRSQDTARALECHELLLRAHARRGDLGKAGIHLAEALGPDRLPELWTAVLPHLHPEIAAAARPGFEAHKYDAAVREAFRVCEEALRARTEGDGSKNVAAEAAAWFGTTPDDRQIEGRNAERPGLAPWARLGQQAGMGQMWVGAFRAMRNPLQHHTMRLSPTDAFAWLWVTHTMRSLLDPVEDELYREESDGDWEDASA
jgi:tetratricopeptide (TPR) repeat protein